MTKKSVKAEVATFVKGLITEASPLNFPENASLSEENFELLRTGVRQRRLGMDYESNHYLEYISPISDFIKEYSSTYVWEDVIGVVDQDFLVVQTGSFLKFFNLAFKDLSQEGYVGSTSLPAFTTGSPVSFTTVDGKLSVVYGSQYIVLITYFPETNVFGLEAGTLKVRDLWGVDYAPADEDIYYRPPQSAPDSHFYNLYNQSWGVPRRIAGSPEKTFSDPIGYFSAFYTELPSYSETVWTAIGISSGSTPYESMRANAWSELIGSQPHAAKGYFIIDALRRGGGRTLAIERNKERYPEMYLSTYAANADITPGGCTVIAEFAGRVFYAGFSGEVIDGDSKSPDLSGYILFSQLVNSSSDVFKCYQEGDPTSREGSDIVDTDGGFVRVSGVSQIKGMIVSGSSLVILAGNGIWELSGGSDYGFSAANYKISKISNFGVVSTASVVRVGETILYWGYNGIYSIARNRYGMLEVSSTTDDTIQTFYGEISDLEKKNSKGVYDDLSKTVRWLYYNSSVFGENPWVMELVLDTRIPAYYVYKIYNKPNTLLKDVFTVPSAQFTQVSDSVVVGVDIVVAGSDFVITPRMERLPTKTTVKYLVGETIAGIPNNAYITFSEYSEGTFRDWGVIDAKAHLLTGAITAGDSSVDKQVPYVTVHMYRTENSVDSNLVPLNPSSCLLRSQWEWSNSPNSNKWSSFQQVYRYRRGYSVNSPSDPYDTGFELITTKNKLRGQGRAVSLYFETEEGKDCRIVGWNININGNATT